MGDLVRLLDRVEEGHILLGGAEDFPVEVHADLAHGRFLVAPRLKHRCHHRGIGIRHGEAAFRLRRNGGGS